MPTFRYKALAMSGEITAGAIDCANRAAAFAELQAKGFLPIEAREARPSIAARLKLPAMQGRSGSSRQLGLALQELAVLLQAGLALDRALDLLAEESAMKRLQPVLKDMLDRVRRGASLSEAAQAHVATFSTSVVTLIEAGEAGGSLETSLMRAADMLLGGAALKDAITSAMLYPMILLVVAGLSLTIILTVVLPEFKPLFEDAGARLPLPTRIIMAIGDAIGDYGIPALLLLGAGAFAARRALQRPSVRLKVDRRILSLPWIGSMLTSIETARFARTLGTLAENGIPLPTALGITCRGFANAALAAAVEQVGASLKEGEGLSGPLGATGLFPRTALHLIEVGEETARLGDMLARLAEILERDVKRSIDRALTLMVPAVTVGLGVIIGGIIASILVAVLSLNDLAM
jgi:general secretion pathway protein F